MKHVGRTIEGIINSKQMLKKNVAESADITPEYLSQILKKKTIDATLLEKLSKALDVNPAIFFDAKIDIDIAGDNNASSVTGPAVIANLDRERDSYKSQIELLKKIIEEKERLIQLLLNKN